MRFQSFSSPSLGLVLAVVLAGALAASGVAAGVQEADAPFAFGFGGDADVDPDALRVTVFARDLPFPYGMAELVDGSLLVATSVPTEGSYYASIGELRRLVDADEDGVADGPGTVLFTGLPGAMTALRRAGNLFGVVSVEPGAERITVLRAGATPADPLVLVGSIDFAYPTPMDHGTYELAMRAAPGRPGRYDLFFNVGSAGNDVAGGSVSVSGLVTGTLQDASIYRVTVDDRGETTIFSDPTLVATGLRNAAGLAVDPASGDLFIADNGIDTPEARLEALGADELNRIPADEIGGDAEDFGFPDAYVDYRTGRPVGERGLPPVVAFGPLGGVENEGTAEIALAPPGFPAGLDDGVFVGFHGQWDDIGLANEENPLAYADPATGTHVHAVANDEPAVGHLDGLLATTDALYVADLTGPGSLTEPSATGIIYQIRATTETSAPGDGTGGPEGPAPAGGAAWRANREPA